MGQDLNDEARASMYSQMAAVDASSRSRQAAEAQRRLDHEIAESEAQKNATDKRVVELTEKLAEVQGQLEAMKAEQGILVQTIRVMAKVLPP